MSEIDFTGEYCVPGKTIKRVEDDHVGRYKFATKFIKGKRVLDIASGEGYGSNILSKGGAKLVIGVELEKKLVQHANKKYKSQKLCFKQGDIMTYKNTEKFDVIVCFETIEHIRNDNKAIKNLYSLLNKGGQILISSPNRLITSPNAKRLGDKPGNRYHVREYILSELEDLLKKNMFKISGVFGQRLRLVTGNKFIDRLILLFFAPDRSDDAKVYTLKFLVPRYFIVHAFKS